MPIAPPLSPAKPLSCCCVMGGPEAVRSMRVPALAPRLRQRLQYERECRDTRSAAASAAGWAPAVTLTSPGHAVILRWPAATLCLVALPDEPLSDLPDRRFAVRD